METPISTTREDWINTALQILIDQGAGEVKILTIAQKLGCSRSNFYWFFKDRDALLSALLACWQAKNTAAIVTRAGLPADRISQGVLQIFDCWADPDLFDARLDFAVREWARRSEHVASEVRRADAQRLEAVAALFTKFGVSATQAIVRARTLYFMQIGYYALEIRETQAERMALPADYVVAFCGEAPLAADIRSFIDRNFR